MIERIANVLTCERNARATRANRTPIPTNFRDSSGTTAVAMSAASATDCANRFVRFPSLSRP